MYQIKNIIKSQKVWPYGPVVFILAMASYFYFYNLGTDTLTLWDEAVHVNVVKNLANDCCAPKLHLTDIIIDFQDWTNNYIWVHKPLMPLFLQAAVYKIGGESLFAFRLPGALFALMSIAALFFIARRHFGYIVALISAALFAFNPYVFELVKGRQFSGLHDLMFVFFAILALDRLLTVLSVPARRHYLWFGLFLGLGYLSKGGLALLFFPALVVVVIIATDKGRASLNFLYAVLLAGAVVAPEKILLATIYPAEYYFELGSQVLHLFKDVEYWGRPWDYYLTVYLREMLLPYLYFPAFVGIVYGINKSRADSRLLVLGSWALAFIVPLSFGVSKISNFILAALPAIFFLLVLMLEAWWRQKKSALMLALSVTFILSYSIIRLDLWRVKYHLFQDQLPAQRLAIFFYQLLAFIALLLIFKAMENNKFLFPTAKTVCVFSLLLACGTYARANFLAYKNLPANYVHQQRVKQAALEINKQNPMESIFLVNFPELKKSHLYFQYWSGRDAMEVYDRQPLFVLQKILPKNRPVWVVADKAMVDNRVILVHRKDWGYLYRLNYDK